MPEDYHIAPDRHKITRLRLLGVAVTATPAAFNENVEECVPIAHERHIEINVRVRANRGAAPPVYFFTRQSEGDRLALAICISLSVT